MANIETAAPSAGYNEQPMSEKGKVVRNLVEADLLDERYATTQRGLKNRHVQLMALGGTIGTGEAEPICHYWRHGCRANSSKVFLYHLVNPWRLEDLPRCSWDIFSSLLWFMPL